MQFSPQEIKDKLIRALDDDNNVVDMAGALEVISILETYPITREALEQTRIGRLINEMRKKVPKGELAKRSRNLVRNWQGLITHAGDTSSASVNGESQHSQTTAVSHIARLSRTTSPAVKGAISPALANSRSTTPKLTVYPAMLSSATLHSRVTSTSSNRISPVSETKSNISNGNNSSVDRIPKTITDSIVRDHSLLAPKLASPGLSQVSPKVCLATVSPKVPALVSAQRESVNSSPSCTLSHSSQTSLGSCPPMISDKEKLSQSSHSNNRHAILSQGRGDGVVVQRKRSRDDLDCDNGVSPAGEHTRQRGSGSFLQKSHSATSLLILNGALGSNQSGGGGGVSSKIQKTDVNENTRDPYTCKFVPSQYTNSADATSQSHSKASSLSLNHGFVPSQGSIKSDAERLKDKVKTPKVKTMAQILAEMQSKSSNVNNTLIAKIARVEREADDIHRSVVPAAALPRSRRKNELSIPNVLANTPRGHKLSQTKTELVEKFLQTSVTPTVSAIDDFSPTRLDLEMSKTSESPPTEDSLPHTPQNSSANFHSFHDTGQGSANYTLHHDRRFSPTNESSTKNKPWVDPFALLQPINLDEIDWDSDKYHMNSPEIVTDASVTRLHSEQWLGVNGCYDWIGEWHDWTETLSLTSYNGELLHILPYVNIDD